MNPQGSKYVEDINNLKIELKYWIEKGEFLWFMLHNQLIILREMTISYFDSKI